MRDRLLCFLACSPRRMTRCGIGPRFSIITVFCGVLTGWLSFRYPAVFGITIIPYELLIGLGCVLMTAGLVLYVYSLRVFNNAYRNQQLATQGPYARVRHPIYAAWILLVCPGVVLCFGSWLMLLLPVVAYLSFKISIDREDRYLAVEFGPKYRKYRKRTRELFPLFY